MAKVIASSSQLDFSLSELESMPLPEKVLLVKPTYFTVEYVINPHMEGHIGDVDKLAAQNEWDHLKSAYDELGYYTHVVEGQRGYPDMVFCANQSFPNITKDGKKQVIMSVMHARERQGEVPFIRKVYEESSYEILYLDESKFNSFEGMGDALWHHKKRLIWGGYGFRTSKEVYEPISDLFDTPVIALELTDERFYHLDTCLCILDEATALIYPKAFTDEGIELIESIFENVIEASKYEAEKLFACNATCPDGKNVFIQQGCVDVNHKLKEAGFKVHEYSTYEFLKSGGSVFCMKMLLW
ncbi:dimethylarginine dimethylaminohydrolase family protein [Gracilimonas mengyeensis]|uniref:N-Dimethylarginine dimethylaminohydrolase n=1 Tax=Gracilimonas mengyeensis TaxID=1302730 RepID=A0A521BRZ3_9BACT|nr:arginine deiminase-related protein [Gracilimonas mengyeensis]SMO49938.1 N-Dimethylarginine dimethylaminohydrolase [Gracilimonas mengyeensis]